METPFAEYPPDPVAESSAPTAKKPWMLVAGVGAAALLAGFLIGIDAGAAPVKDLKSQLA